MLERVLLDRKSTCPLLNWAWSFTITHAKQPWMDLHWKFNSNFKTISGNFLRSWQGRCNDFSNYHQHFCAENIIKIFRWTCKWVQIMCESMLQKKIWKILSHQSLLLWLVYWILDKRIVLFVIYQLEKLCIHVEKRHGRRHWSKTSTTFWWITNRYCRSWAGWTDFMISFLDQLYVTAKKQFY